MQQQQQQQQQSRCSRRWLCYEQQQEEEQRYSGGKRLRRNRERNHFARRDLHETALKAVLANHHSTTMRRRRPTQQQQQQQTIGPTDAGFVSPWSISIAAKAKRQRGPEPYSHRKYLIELYEKIKQCDGQTVVISQQQQQHQQEQEQQQQQHLSFVSQMSSGLVSGSSSSSSLARELMDQRMRQTISIELARTIERTKTIINEAQLIKSRLKNYQWHWEDSNAIHSNEPYSDTTGQRILSDDKLEVCFHPECSQSTVAIRGSEPFKRNGNYYYWEVTIHDKIFGTSMMLGLCTDEQKLEDNNYCNLIGLNQFGWSLSHHGLIWHNGKYSKYTNDFTSNQTLTVGLLYDTMRGELSYFLNGENLGVAFSGLNKCSKDLYPVVGSTAKRTRMRLTASHCGLIRVVSLFERSCYSILNRTKNKAELVQTLEDNKVPKSLINHMVELA